MISDFHASYQRAYIERNVRLMIDMDDLHQFGRFVRLAAALVAQEMNYSQLGREIGVTPQTAKRWLNALSQAFIWFEVPAYSNHVIKRISEKSKGYFFDTGQICFSQMISSYEGIASHPLGSAIFENAVVNELYQLTKRFNMPPQLYHWRLYSGAEVAIVIEFNGKFYPIDIKANSRPSAKDARGIHAFRENYPFLSIQKGLILAPTQERYAITPLDYVMPWDMK